ncbi:hypothetical protein JYT12_00395 [Beggiatoa alba]|nr:hypothetical protein [Beggiatoa alba]
MKMNFRLAIFMCAFGLCSPSIFAVDESKDPTFSSQSRFIVNITKALDSNELSKAKKLILDARKKFPNSSGILHQAARYEIKLGFKQDENIAGGIYTAESSSKAIALINEAREKPDFDGSILSLLVHIHARNGDVDKARKALSDFHSMNASDPWIEVNTALVHMAENKLDKAHQALKEIIARKKLRDVQYSAAWYYLGFLRKFDSRYETNEAVKSGLMRRVEANELVQYIKNYKGKKPLFAAISSDDRYCPYCVTDNKLYPQFIEKQKDNYEFILTTVEPWQAISTETEIYKFFPITGVPFNSIIHEGKMLDYNSGTFRSSANALTMLRLNSIRIENNIIERFSDGLDDRARLIRSYRFISRLFSYASITQKYRSMAVAIADDNWSHTAGWGKSGSDQKQANSEAIAQCERNRKNDRRLNKYQGYTKLSAKHNIP